MAKHILIRLSIFILLLALLFGVYLYQSENEVVEDGGYATSGLEFLFRMFNLLSFGAVYLLVEATWLHRKGKRRLRNLNIFIAIPVLVFTLWTVYLFTGQFFWLF